MKLKIILIAIFLLSASVRADYSPYSIKQLIEKAEIIGKCKIVSVSKNTFTVKFIDLIKGKSSKTLEIIKFQNWTCAKRQIDYKVGHTELIFLIKNENGWRALGAGNEGEMFIQKNIVCYKSYDLRKPITTFEIEGKKLRGVAFDYKEVKSAINYYLKNSIKLNKLNDLEIKNFKSDNLFLESIIKSYSYS